MQKEQEKLAELTHQQLWTVCERKPSDLEPYGQRRRWAATDCSAGCKWYHILIGGASKDWGVCGNPLSARAGLLTFEHQGCPEFERE
jgi:hypothetical protein